MTAPLLALLLGAPLQVGDRAPDFTLPDTEGQPVALAKLLESGPVILAFYPKAFTPGCTAQNQAFRDHFSDVQGKGGQVVGISADPVETQRKFKAEYKLPYPLLSDPDGKVIAAYVGKMPILGLANRANVVIGQDGRIAAIVEGGAATDPTSAIRQCPLRKKGST